MYVQANDCYAPVRNSNWAPPLLYEEERGLSLRAPALDPPLPWPQLGKYTVVYQVCMCTQKTVMHLPGTCTSAPPSLYEECGLLLCFSTPTLLMSPPRTHHNRPSRSRDRDSCTHLKIACTYLPRYEWILYICLQLGYVIETDCLILHTR